MMNVIYRKEKNITSKKNYQKKRLIIKPTSNEIRLHEGYLKEDLKKNFF